MFTVSELTHGAVEFAPHDKKTSSLRPDFYIPDSVSFESVNTYGSFLYQISEHSQFTFWKSIYAPKEDITLRVTENDTWLGFRLMLKKHIRHRVSGRSINLMQGQVSFAYTPIIDNEFKLKKDEVYEVFDMRVTTSLLKNLKIKEQHFTKFLDSVGMNKPEWLTEKPAFSNVVVLDTVDYLSKDPAKENVAEEVVRQVIGTLTRKRDAERKISEQQLENLYEVREEIRQQFSERMHLEEWATKARMNITYFKEMFRQVFELTPYHYLLYERIKAAKALMIEEPNLSFAEVALRCGFSSYNNLRRAFAAKENKTLTEWRNLPDFLVIALAWELVIEDAAF